MPCVADATPLMALEALEERLRKESQEREERLRKEFKADVAAELAVERERRLQAESTVRALEAKLRKYTVARQSCGPYLQVDDDDCLDTLAEHRCSPHLMEDMFHMAAPKNDGSSATTSESVLLEGGAYKSLEYMSEAQIEGMEFDYKPLSQDMWGVAIMTLTRDLAEIMRGNNLCAHLTRFIYALGCCALNLFLQVKILLWVNRYVVGESVWTIQGNYWRFHHDMFDKTGRFNETAWMNWGSERDELCGAVLTNTLFLGCILFLWIGRMLAEYKDTHRLIKEIHALPNVPPEASIHNTVLHRNGQAEIIGMSWCTRVILYVIVVVPKLGVCMLLMVIGCQWLTATESFSDLILNALALEFVIGIDEQILQFFLPKRAADTVGNTVFAYPSKGPPTEEDDLRAMESDYHRNIFYFVCCFCFTLLYLLKFQWVLPDYGRDIGPHCGAWYENRFIPKCDWFEKGCFPHGNTTKPHDYSMAVPHP